ncbi:proline dehydrogenase family protein [Paenibacillus sp. GSMTC-2017]|uniref:proline dehydrogenase family protein n=1 Tax=Paenibacillus sp. GSMTC-2017 TaxID=2794350 RepID=UPI0018D74DDF|nr:proline dehydrogenase family protein [Paenibacillus sp. GSMTC-2017]MBH5320427.1 proline dehydrogenase family protein [Paenibacillus sp. GSMTC-2017]
MLSPAIQLTDALKSISRNDQIKTYIRQSEELYPLLWKAARRFVTGESKVEAIDVANQLLAKGYAVSVEYIGENTSTVEECEKVKDEFLAVIEGLGGGSSRESISLDLSHIGLTVSKSLAYTNLLELAEKAQESGISIMIGMEESSKTDAILDIYKRVTDQYPNVGVTLQAHLHRSQQDLKELLHFPGRIRLVKGAYQESAGTSFSRSTELNDRYLNMAMQILRAKHPVSIATHDEVVLQELELRYELTSGTYAEYEMLYGIRPERISELKRRGNSCRVYLPYGQEWYLYVCHRIAENPENLYQAVADMIHPFEGEGSLDYE